MPQQDGDVHSHFPRFNELKAALRKEPAAEKRRIRPLTLCTSESKMQAAVACCGELPCALLLPLFSPTSEKTPLRNEKRVSWMAAAEMC